MSCGCNTAGTARCASMPTTLSPAVESRVTPLALISVMYHALIETNLGRRAGCSGRVDPAGAPTTVIPRGSSSSCGVQLG